MALGLSDAELEAVAREIHAMYHAGAPEADALARFRSRMARGRYSEVPRLMRPLVDRATKTAFGKVWGPRHCGRDHEIVICDEPADV